VLNLAVNVEPESETAKAAGITAFVTAYLVEVFTILGHPPPDGGPAADAGEEATA
jgi:hypothetical protein